MEQNKIEDSISDQVKQDAEKSMSEAVALIPEIKKASAVVKSRIAPMIVSTFNTIREYQDMADKIVVKSIDDKLSMKQAKTTRIAIKNSRLDAVSHLKTRREELAEAMAEYKEEDIIMLRLTQFISDKFDPIEKSLAAKEKYKETYEKEAKEQLNKERMDILAPYVGFYNPIMDTTTMDQSQFNIFLDSVKSAKKTAEDNAEREKAIQQEVNTRKALLATRNSKIASFTYAIDPNELLPVINDQTTEEQYAEIISGLERSAAAYAERKEQETKQREKVSSRHSSLVSRRVVYDGLEYIFHESRIKYETVMGFTDEEFNSLVALIDKKIKQLHEEAILIEAKSASRRSVLLSIGCSLDESQTIIYAGKPVKNEWIQTASEEGFNAGLEMIKQAIFNHNELLRQKESAELLAKSSDKQRIKMIKDQFCAIQLHHMTHEKNIGMINDISIKLKDIITTLTIAENE